MCPLSQEFRVIDRSIPYPVALDLLLKMRRAASKKTGQSNSTPSLNSSAADLFRSGTFISHPQFPYLIFHQLMLKFGALSCGYACTLIELFNDLIKGFFYFFIL